MTTLIEGLLLDRLIREVERRTEADRGRADGLRTLENASRDMAALVSKYGALQDERDRLIANNKTLEENFAAFRKRAAEALPRLAELYDSAEMVVREARRRKRTKSMDDLLGRLDGALRGAFDHCDQIPF